MTSTTPSDGGRSKIARTEGLRRLVSTRSGRTQRSERSDIAKRAATVLEPSPGTELAKQIALSTRVPSPPSIPLRRSSNSLHSSRSSSPVGASVPTSVGIGTISPIGASSRALSRCALLSASKILLTRPSPLDSSRPDRRPRIEGVVPANDRVKGRGYESVEQLVREIGRVPDKSLRDVHD